MAIPLLTIASLVPVPFLSASASILVEVLTPRTLEENVLQFQTRSQHIGSLSAVSAFLAAVQAQFISFTYQKNDKPLQKAANVCFFLGVSLNVIGATTSLMATSSLPSPTGLQEYLVAYQRAIDEAERITEAMGALDTSQLMLVEEQVKSWGRTHHRHITNLLITGNLIARWNIQRFVYALVMLTGVVVFFLGLISLISYSLIQTVKAVSSLGYLHFGRDHRSFLRRIFSEPDYFAEEKRSREASAKRQQVVAAMYKLCSDQRFV